MGDTSRYSGLDQEPDAGKTRGLLFHTVRNVLRKQFGQPTGLVGRVAGFVMSRTSSNLERIEWTLSLLDVKPNDRILEVGFGPGIAIELAAKLAPQGVVAGIDHSDEMVRLASRRNAAAVRAGRVLIARASASDPPAFDAPFDKIFTINSIHFWNDPVDCLARLRRLLRPGGTIAVTLQPRMRTATDDTAAALGAEIAEKMKRAGFSKCEVKLKKIAPVAVACVLATN